MKYTVQRKSKATTKDSHPFENHPLVSSFARKEKSGAEK